MKLTQIVFSPTGGTAKVSKTLAEAMDESDHILDLTDKSAHFVLEEFKKKDVVIIAVPSYGGRMPEVARDRLSLIKGGGARAVLVVCYGNRAYEDTLVEMQDVAEKAGFVVIGAVAAVTEHSICHEYATKRPDRADKRRLKEIGKELKAKIENGDDTTPSIPGNRPYREIPKIPIKPKTKKKACIDCGLCVKKCPVGAISKKDPRKIKKDKCISCMRCVAICPEDAKKVDKAMLKMASHSIKKEARDAKEYESYL